MVSMPLEPETNLSVLKEAYLVSRSYHARSQMLSNPSNGLCTSLSSNSDRPGPKAPLQPRGLKVLG